jgi:hypothetical protein
MCKNEGYEGKHPEGIRGVNVEDLHHSTVILRERCQALLPIEEFPERKVECHKEQIEEAADLEEKFCFHGSAWV